VVVHIGLGGFGVGELPVGGTQVAGSWHRIVAVIGMFESIEVELVPVVAAEPENCCSKMQRSDQLKELQRAPRVHNLLEVGKGYL
jgi:hypothetical protein